MADLFEIKEAEERVILIAVSVNEEEDTAASLDELEELVKTAGAFTVGKVIQNRERIHPGTYLGKGKIEEVKELIWELGATGVVCDDELSPAQMRSMRLDAYLASVGQAVIQRGSGGCLYLLLANPAATFLLIISRLTGRERVSVNAGQWFGNEMEGAVITHWASVSLVVQIGLAALLIWIAIRAISEKKR